LLNGSDIGKSSGYYNYKYFDTIIAYHQVVKDFVFQLHLFSNLDPEGLE